MKAVIYTRVSSANRSRYGDALAYDQNPEVQEAPLRRMIDARGWTLLRVYADRASGAKENRAALDKLLADARLGAFNIVVVWRFDRLSRSVLHFLSMVGELRSLGVNLISHEQAFDSTTPMGKFTLTMFGALAELEREVIRDRVRAGIEHARVHGTKSGLAIGRPRRVFDHQAVAQLRAEGLSFRQIAGRLGVGYGTVLQAFRAVAGAPELIENPVASISIRGADQLGLTATPAADRKGDGFGSA